MSNMAESMAVYAQPLLDDTDGSQEQMQKVYSIAQMCWNLSLLPENKQRDSLAKMQPLLEMNDAEFSNFRDSIIDPMIKRHYEMFPSMHRNVAEKIGPRTRKEKYPGTGRNEPCPCNSGKKYKKCCCR